MEELLLAILKGGEVVADCIGGISQSDEDEQAGPDEDESNREP
ncbi:hypothetical protein [Halovenus carboxidivorans]|nr:hypothetical protein [Halovenus carboxidivorans]